MSLIGKIIDKIRHNYYTIGRVLVFVVAAALVFWQLPRTGKFKYEYQLSKPWQHETLYAPFDFPIYKDNETLWAENEAATQKVKPVFVFDESQTLASLNTLTSTFESNWNPNTSFDREATLDFLLKVYDSIEDQGIVAYNKAVENLNEASEVSLIRTQVMRTVRYGEFYTMNTATDALASLLKTAGSTVDTALVSTLLEIKSKLLEIKKFMIFHMINCSS